MSDMYVFVDRINKMLERRRMTQRELAEKIGKTEVSVSRYVSGQRVPKATVLLKIAQALDVQADYLIGNDSWFDCGDAVDPDDRGGCEWCNVERKDWKSSEIPINAGDFGKYLMNIYISNQAIGVEVGKEKEEPIMTVYSSKIKYCPYCGRKLGKNHGQ